MDPDSLNPDQDPPFQVIPDTDPGFHGQELKKKMQLKNFYIFFWSKITMSTVHEKPSALKREYPARQKRIINFFLFLGVIFALLDPDPQHWSVV